MFSSKIKKVEKASKPRRSNGMKRNSKSVLDPKLSPNYPNRIPYNFLGEAVSSVTVSRKDHEDCNTNKENPGILKPQSVTQNGCTNSGNLNSPKDQKHFKSVSDYYEKLQTSKPLATSTSIFKEITSRFQDITNMHGQNFTSFSECLHKQVKLKVKCESRFHKSVANIKALVEDVNNGTVIADSTEAEVILSPDDAKDNFTQVPLLCLPNEWVESTPKNQKTQPRTIKTPTYKPCILLKSPEMHPFTNEFPTLFLKRQQRISDSSNNNVLLFNIAKRRKGIFDEQQHDNIVNTNPKSGTFSPTCFKFNNLDTSIAMEGHLDIDDSFLFPAVPVLRDPSPLKFYPRKIFKSDS